MRLVCTSLVIFIVLTSHFANVSSSPVATRSRKPSGLNLRPIIGIMTQPVSDTVLNNFGTYALNADYVKWVEGSGARVVPVPFNSTPEVLDYYFESINGLIFPGGSDIINHTQYYDSAEYLFKRAIQANDQGDYFPIWGTCLGFELISMIADGGDISILTPTDAEDVSLPLKFTVDPKLTRMFSSLPENLIRVLESEPITDNYHHWGITPESYLKFPKASDFFNVLTTSVDLQGVTFISSIEAKKYPIYGVQWHPERSLFEWGIDEHINHSPDTIVIMQYMSNFFVNEARKSFHAFPSPQQEDKALIYHYIPTYVGNLGIPAEQFYFFSN